MNKAAFIFTFFVLFLFSGCTGGTDTTTSDPNTPPNINTNLPSAQIPPQQPGIGYPEDLADYLFAVPALEQKSVFKTFLITTQSADGFFDRTSQRVQRVQEGLEDNFGDKIVNIFEENELIQHAVIDESRISVTFYQNGIETGMEQYRREFRLHEDMLRTNQGACVYRNILENLEISEIIPRQANPNESDAWFSKVLHLYCATVEGKKIDRYYAQGWGVIAEIITKPNGETDYSVLDQSSYRIPGGK